MRKKIGFRLFVKDAESEWYEDYNKEIGESNHVRQYGWQPTFTGDIEAWGKAIIDWFNEGAEPGKHRTFVRVERLGAAHD